MLKVADRIGGNGSGDQIGQSEEYAQPCEDPDPLHEHTRRVLSDACRDPTDFYPGLFGVLYPVGLVHGVVLRSRSGSSSTGNWRSGRHVHGSVGIVPS